MSWVSLHVFSIRSQFSYSRIKDAVRCHRTQIPYSNVSWKAQFLWHALVSKANNGTFAVWTFRRPSRLWDVKVSLVTDVSRRPVGAVSRVPGRCGRCIIQGLDDVGSDWCCRIVDDVGSDWCCRIVDEPVMLLGRGYQEDFGVRGVKRSEDRIKEGKSVIYRCQVSANNIVLSKP